MNFVRIILKPKKEQSILRFHPWVFSGAIAHIDGDPEEGDVVEVYSNRKQYLGSGHYAGGSIAVRIFSFEKTEAGIDFWIDKISTAKRLRETILLPSGTTNAYRLIHGEGDSLSGLIIDVYNKAFIIQCHSIGMHKMRNNIKEALLRVFADDVVAVYDKSANTLPKKYAAENVDEALFGTPQESEILENGHRFLVNWEKGQKTGFFLDQRENRNLLAKYAKGKSVLNTFCYSGGFSIYALQAGASKVHSLDSSQAALDLTDKNVLLGNYPKEKHKNIKADAVEYLKNLKEDYDIIILDPPAFAKHRSAKHAAIQAYKRLNENAISQIKSGGLIFTFSCSQVIDKNLFQSSVTAAAISAGRKVRILHQLQQPADHPINIFHPEGEYLKGLVIEVE